MRPASIGMVPPPCENSQRMSRLRAKVPESSRLVTARVVSCGTSITAGNVPTLKRAQQAAASGWK
jgi:hypothetical protein